MSSPPGPWVRACSRNGRVCWPRWSSTPPRTTTTPAWARASTSRNSTPTKAPMARGRCAKPSSRRTTRQGGYPTQPIIVLDGSGGSGNGFTLNSSADGSTIRGFVIRDFAADGIHIDSGSDGHTIVGNFIGSFNADGSNAGTVERNGSAGIDSNGANVVIGGTTAADRNVISGNTSAYNIYLATGANGT